MIPYSRPKLSDLYIPFTAAHTYIAHIWQYPPRGGGGGGASVQLIGIVPLNFPQALVA